MTLRIEFPAARKRQIGGARVFELQDVVGIEITSLPDDVVRVRVETQGAVLTLCPGCRAVVRREDVS